MPNVTRCRNMGRVRKDTLKTDILFIDIWMASTKTHFVPIYKQLQMVAPELAVKALHTGRIVTRDRSLPKVTHIDGLGCYDVSYFRHPRRLREILRYFSPSIVVVLTPSFLFDRAIIQLCRDMGITTFFLQHGAINFSIRKPALKASKILSVYADKARRYLLYYLPVYATIVFPHDCLFFFKPRFIKFLIGSIFRNYAFSPPKSLPKIHTDHALVYGKWYAETVKNMYGYQDNQVHIVGNLTFDPMADIDKRDIVRRETWLKARKLDPTRRTITYLPQPLVEEGYVEKSEFQSYLAVLANQVKEKELNLIIKLHPRNDVAIFRPLMDKELIAVEEKDLAESIYFSDAVVGHSSTALGLAIVAYKPLIIWNTFESMSGSFLDPEDLKSVAHVATTQSELGSTLEGLSNNEWKCDRSPYNGWMRKYSHFDLKEKAVERITTYLIAEYKRLTGKSGEDR